MTDPFQNFFETWLIGNFVMGQKFNFWLDFQPKIRWLPFLWSPYFFTLFEFFVQAMNLLDFWPEVFFAMRRFF